MFIFQPRYVIKNKSSKIFGDKVINKPTMDYLHIYMANGELARSSVINRVNVIKHHSDNTYIFVV